MAEQGEVERRGQTCRSSSHHANPSCHWAFCSGNYTARGNSSKRSESRRCPQSGDALPACSPLHRSSGGGNDYRRGAGIPARRSRQWIVKMADSKLPPGGLPYTARGTGEYSCATGNCFHKEKEPTPGKPTRGSGHVKMVLEFVMKVPRGGEHRVGGGLAQST